MMSLHQLKTMLLAPAASLSLTLAAVSPAQAEVGQVDGNYWTKSSVEQKQAYLVGVSNVLSVNNELNRRKGAADEQSAMTRYLRATDVHTIAAIQQKLDSWYAANPDKLNTPVLGVIWMGLVKAAK